MADNVTDPAAAWPDAVEVELEPLDTGEDKGPGQDQAQARTVLGRTNRIRLGAPRHGDHVAELLAQSHELPADIRQRIKDGYDFRRVRPSITLLPADGCVFVAAELGIELLADNTPATASYPIAYDVQPIQILEETRYKLRSAKGRELSAEAAAGLAKLVSKATSESSYERDEVHYVRRLYGYGVNFSEVGWRLQATPEHELVGDVHGLSFVAQVPTGARLSGRFHFVAEIAIHASGDRWMTRTFRPRRKNPVLDAHYPLS